MNCPLFSSCVVLAGNFSSSASENALRRRIQVWSGEAISNAGPDDSDADGVGNAIETALGTNPNNPDTDGDGIADYDEMVARGSTSFAGFDGSLVFPWLGGTSDANVGADPLVKDLFVEVDCMTTTGHNHNPQTTGNWTTFQSDMTSIFYTDNAWTGKLIRPHMQISQGITESLITVDPACKAPVSGVGGTEYFYTYKNDPSFFTPLRAEFYHYIILGHQTVKQAGTPVPTCQAVAQSGIAEMLGPDVLVTLGGGAVVGVVGTPAQQMGTFIHELGHNLGLVHNGNASNPPVSANSCIHSSVMNYRYQMGGWGAATNLRGFGYSKGTCSAVQPSGCGFSCTAGCVPAPFSLTSPKQPACALGAPGCDCDVNEWGTKVTTNFVGIGVLTTFDFGCPLPGGNCAGAGESALRSARENRQAEAGDFFRGDTARRTPWQAEFAKKRIDHLRSKGMIEGSDFRVEPTSGRAYAVE